MLFGRNPNRPYDVRQLFGGAGSQLDRPKHWDSYEMESQKFLQIGEWWKLNTKFCYCFWRENQASQTNLLIVHTTRSQKWWLSSTISWFLNFMAKTCEIVMDYFRLQNRCRPYVINGDSQVLILDSWQVASSG